METAVHQRLPAGILLDTTIDSDEFYQLEGIPIGTGVSDDCGIVTSQDLLTGTETIKYNSAFLTLTLETQLSVLLM